MRVALNLVYLVPGETGGMETVARGLIPHLARIPDLELTALVGREVGDGPWSDLPCEVLPVRASSRAQWVLGEQWHVARRGKPFDLVHSLASTAPVWGRFRRVTTIHDLHYKVVPEAHFGLRGLGMRVLVPAAARASDRIIAVSDTTRRDIVNHLRVPEDRVDVIHNGVGPPSVAPALDVRERLGLGDRPLLLSLSAKRPHKNLMGLLDALALLAPERRPLTVLPGYPTSHEAQLRARSEELGLTADVRFLEWLPEEDVEGLFAEAAAAVHPSLYEGFGLPVLEAMARGVPVACSGRASLPEVAGDAAILFDPSDPRSIAAALERVLADDGTLRRAGIRRAAHFSWRRAAELTAVTYERALR